MSLYKFKLFNNLSKVRQLSILLTVVLQITVFAYAENSQQIRIQINQSKNRFQEPIQVNIFSQDSMKNENNQQFRYEANHLQNKQNNLNNRLKKANALENIGGSSSGGGTDLLTDFVNNAEQEVLPWILEYANLVEPRIDVEKFKASIDMNRMSQVPVVYPSCFAEHRLKNQNEDPVAACYNQEQDWTYLSESMYPVDIKMSPSKRGLIAHEIFRRMNIEFNDYTIVRQIPMFSEKDLQTHERYSEETFALKDYREAILNAKSANGRMLLTIFKKTLEKLTLDKTIVFNNKKEIQEKLIPMSPNKVIFLLHLVGEKYHAVILNPEDSRIRVGVFSDQDWNKRVSKIDQRLNEILVLNGDTGRMSLSGNENLCEDYLQEKYHLKLLGEYLASLNHENMKVDVLAENSFPLQSYNYLVSQGVIVDLNSQVIQWLERMSILKKRISDRLTEVMLISKKCKVGG